MWCGSSLLSTGCTEESSSIQRIEAPPRRGVLSYLTRRDVPLNRVSFTVKIMRHGVLFPDKNHVIFISIKMIRDEVGALNELK